MVEIKNVQVYGLEKSFKVSGYPMSIGDPDDIPEQSMEDMLKRAKTLGSAISGSGHDNFLKGIIVQFDIKYPQYWTPEAQRYHWFEIVSSQSKMHRLMKVGTRDDFFNMFNKYVDTSVIENVKTYIDMYNKEPSYFLFMKALSNLPMGYELWEGITTNYLQLKTMYLQRKNHKLKEDWGAFIKMCEELPMFLELTNVKG